MIVWTSPRPRLDKAFLVIAGLAVFFRLWTSLCFFPLAEWNCVRLTPTFMLFFGSTPYPGINAGPVTTWIYGPVPLLINAPAVLGHSIVPALLIAGVITLFVAVISALVAMKACASQCPDCSYRDCLWAVLLCLALWPNPSLQYIQADNFAVAFGLLANFCLLKSKAPTKRWLQLAAVCAALAVWSKQPAIGLIPAQILWLGIVYGIGTAIYYGAACLAVGLLLGGIFVAWFGFPELWLNLVQIPSQLPFCDDPLTRSREAWMHLAGYVFFPALGCVAFGRTVWKKDSPWLLPAIIWLVLLPTSLVSLYKIGGATNSLNSILYLLPVAALMAVQKIHRIARARAGAWLAFAVLAILTQQLKFAPVLPVRPMITALVEAEELSKNLPGQIYFPWHPLVTFFSERRFYDSEDGFFTRQASHLKISPDATSHHLPPNWSITAVPGWRQDGTYKQLQPVDAKLAFSGKWTLYYWPASQIPKKVD